MAPFFVQMFAYGLHVTVDSGFVRLCVDCALFEVQAKRKSPTLFKGWGGGGNLRQHMTLLSQLYYSKEQYPKLGSLIQGLR